MVPELRSHNFVHVSQTRSGWRHDVEMFSLLLVRLRGESTGVLPLKAINVKLCFFHVVNAYMCAIPFFLSIFSNTKNCMMTEYITSSCAII